jgi:hypothetical protein
LGKGINYESLENRFSVGRPGCIDGCGCRRGRLQQQHTDTSVAQDTGGGSDSSAPACKTDPNLHPETTQGTIFCGYTPGDAGMSFDCTKGQQCCLGGSIGGGNFAPEKCATWGSVCDNPAPVNGSGGGLPIECNQVADCAANGKAGAACCLQGGASQPSAVAGCDEGDLKSSGGSGIVCEGASAGGDGGAADGGGGGGTVPACAAGEIQICALDSDCPANKTCTAMRWKLYEVGFCK